MDDLAIITPSRDRPDRLYAMAEAIFATAKTRATLYIGLDDDDESDYSAFIGQPWPAVVYRSSRRSLAQWSNDLAGDALRAYPPRFLASLGDDHMPRTPGWDVALCDAIKAMPGGHGFAYGNDLFQGPRVPTAWVASASVVHALGWMMLPACQHMYVDDAIRELGDAAGCITYLPDVIVEHMHPQAGKAQLDESYRSTNTPEQFEIDRKAYEAWRHGAGFIRDLGVLQRLIEWG